MNKVVCFRFDVDTYPCAARGVPNLVALARRHDAKFTFYFNMGRAVHLPSLLSGRKQAEERAAKLGNMQKLGPFEWMRTVLCNPRVGSTFPQHIIEAYREGHEVGLHGGRNHGEWMASVHSWPETKVADEVEWGLARLADAGIGDVHSFSSPGWQAPASLHAVLAQHGITSVADVHGHGEHRITNSMGTEQELHCIPTNILGEPGGVGYIEHLRASAGSGDAMLERFRFDLENSHQPAVLYDHPYYAGIREIEFVDSMLNHVSQAGYTTARMDELPGLFAPR